MVDLVAAVWEGVGVVVHTYRKRRVVQYEDTRPVRHTRQLCKQEGVEDNYRRAACRPYHLVRDSQILQKNGMGEVAVVAAAAAAVVVVVVVVVAAVLPRIWG